MDHSKEALRVYFSKKRGALSPEIQDSYSLDIANFVFKTTYLGVRIFSSVFTYIPQKVR